MVQQRCHIDQIVRQEVLTETSANTQSSAVNGDTNSELNDDDTIETLTPAKDSVTSTNTGVTAQPSIRKPTQLLQHPIHLNHFHSFTLSYT